MPAYIWTESDGTTLNVTPRVASTKFGDGYEETAPWGLNPIQQVWQVQHRGIDIDAADEIEAFLKARFSAAGLEPFDYTPLWSTVPLKFRCRQWTRSQDADPHTCTITAQFEQVFVA